MKRLFQEFLKEKDINLNATDIQFTTSVFNVRKLTIDFSAWLSGLKENGSRRFQSVYRVNKFMVRKWINKLVV